jgi:hypothetical protein
VKESSAWDGLRSFATSTTDTGGGVFTMEALDAFRKRLERHEPRQPELELVGPKEYGRRLRRHREHGISMRVDSRIPLEWLRDG